MDEHETANVIEVLRNGNGGRKTDTNGNGTSKAIAIITGVSALVALVYSQIAPLQQRLDANEARMQRVDERTQAQIATLDEKLQVEVAAASSVSRLESERTKARLNSLEQWLGWWNKNKPIMDADQNARLRAVERDLFGTPILVPKRTAPSTEIMP